MPKGHPPSLFVSSTCYDLSQVRADLADFGRQLGLDPVLSELDSFPVDPTSTTVANCLEAVRARADIFLLIVGTRYGSIVDSGKSVTNLEFLEATAKAIPRYVFVKRDIMALLPVWKANPTADFSGTVDTPKLLEFVAGLRGSGDLWVFPFDTAQDISQTLRKQLAFLLSDCLSLRLRVSTRDVDLLELGPQTLRVYLERPDAWEFKAFAKALPECIRRHQAVKFDYELGLNFAAPIEIPDRIQARDWIQSKVSQMMHVVENLSRAVNDGLKVAVGPPGKSGDIARIWHLAKRVADAYLVLLQWALEFDRLDAHESAQKALSLVRSMVSNIISEIESFSDGLFDQVVNTLKKPKVDRKITMTLTIPETTALLDEVGRLYAR